MNIEQFFMEVRAAPLSVKVDSSISARKVSLDNEALFQLPFICMVILTFSKGQRKPYVAQVGQLIGECLEAVIPAFKGSSQHLGWSSNLRVRTVKAINFLELAGLIQVDNRNSQIKTTDLGAKVIKRALDGEDDLAYNLTAISREYRNINVARQLDMELSE